MEARLLKVTLKPLVQKDLNSTKLKNAHFYKNWFLYRRSYEKPFLTKYKNIIELKKKTKLEKEAAAWEKQKEINKLYKEKKLAERSIRDAQFNARHKMATDWLSISADEPGIKLKDFLNDKNGSIKNFMTKFGLNYEHNYLIMESHLWKNNSNDVFHHEEFYSWDQETKLAALIEHYRTLPKYKDLSYQQIFNVAYAKDLKIRLEKQMREKLKECGLELKNTTDANIETQKFKLLDAPERKLKSHNADFEISRFWYVEPKGYGSTKERLGLITRKIKMTVDIESLNLPTEVRKRLIKLAGLRFSGGKLKIVTEQQPTAEENYAYAKKLLKDLLHESFLAYPHYVPLSDLETDPNDLVENEDPGIEEAVEANLFEVDREVVPFVEGLSEHVSPEFIMRYDQVLHPKVRLSMGLHPVSDFHRKLQSNIAEKDARTDKKSYTIFRYHPFE